MSSVNERLGNWLFDSPTGLSITLSIIAVGTIAKGWALQHLWGWFIHPLGLIDLSLANAIGISMVASTLTHQLSPEKAKETRYDTGPLIYALAGPFISVGLGYIVQMFM